MSGSLTITESQPSVFRAFPELDTSHLVCDEELAGMDIPIAAYQSALCVVLCLLDDHVHRAFRIAMNMERAVQGPGRGKATSGATTEKCGSYGIMNGSLIEEKAMQERWPCVIR